MGRRVKCPHCGDEFWLHGRGTGSNYAVVDCYNCNGMFNPRKQSNIPGEEHTPNQDEGDDEE